jgi:RNA polymerase subunit RPABC4/transcription elongation factor Spt4
MAGRGLRPSPGKEMLLLDHGGCIEENGLLTDPIEWSLDGRRKAWKKGKSKVAIEKKDRVCSSCALLFSGSSLCPDCGSEAKGFGKKVEVVDADLEEINPKKASTADKARFLAMLKAYIPKQNNPNPKRIIGTFRGRFGIWPHHSYKDCAPMEPDDTFRAYMKYQAIKYAKQQEKRQTQLNP